MKSLHICLLILCFVYLFIDTAQAADPNLVDMTELAAAASTDIIYIIDDPNGTPYDRKIEVGDLFGDLMGTSALLRGILSDESGTGVSIFGTSPTFTTSILAASQAAIGSTSYEFGDIFIGDGKAIKFGDDQDTTLTHVADTGLQMALDFSIMFGDTAVYIESDDDGYLDLDADTGIRLNADTLVTGLFQYSTTTVTAAGPTDNLDVGGVNVVLLNTNGNDVTIGGLTNGVSGQILYVAVIDATNDAVLEHAEGTGNQDIYLSEATDESLRTSYGGWTLSCNGTHWYEVSDARDKIATPIKFSMVTPQSIGAWTGRANASAPVWFNDTGRSVVITSIKAWSDTDNYDFTLFESASETDLSDENDTQIDLIECDANGTECFYDAETSFDHAIIEDGHHIIFEHTAGTANKISVVINGDML